MITWSKTEENKDTVDGVASAGIVSSSGVEIDDSSITTIKAWSSSKINTELGDKEDSIPANTYEPYDIAIVKSDENETITGTWTFSSISEAIKFASAASGISFGQYGNITFGSSTTAASQWQIIDKASSVVHKFFADGKYIATSSIESTSFIENGTALSSKYEPKDTAIVKSDENETITGTWTFNTDITATNFIDSSDKRLKKNVKPIKEKFLNDFDKIEPVQYRLKKGDKSLQFGVIAQDIEKYFSDAVSIDNNGFKGVNYRTLSTLTMAKVQTQQKEIEELREALNELIEKVG